MPVLISYSHIDRTRALLLKRALTQKGIGVWLDEHNIELGEPIQERLLEMIRECDMMLVLTTPNSLTSEWIAWEIAEARTREDRERQWLILPILLSGENLHPALYGRKYADFRTQETQERGFNSLVRKLLNQQSAEDPALSNNVDLFTPRGLPVMAPTAAVVPAPVPEEPEEDSSLVYLESPIVGTAYLRPSPDSPRFVQVGDRVRRWQVVMIIEAMKLMNEIEAQMDGVVVKVFSEEGQPVEYGEHLMAFEPLDP